MKHDCKILICGDLCLLPETAAHFESGNASRLFKGLMEMFRQADLLYGLRKKDPDWNQGLLVKILLTENVHDQGVIKYFPIAADETGVDLMPANKAESFLSEFLRRSKRIGDKSFAQSSWQEFCERKQAHYLPLLLGLGRVVNFANRKVRNRIVNLLYTKNQLRGTLNLVRCESHHEVVETILKRATDAEQELSS